MGYSTEVETMATLFKDIHDLYMRCFPESSPHKIKPQNASNYVMQLMATCEVLTAYRHEKLVGCIIYQKFFNTLLGEDEMYIHEWFIHPLWRKKLVGKELLDGIVKLGKDKQCKRLRGVSWNRDMLNTIKSHGEANLIALVVEKEL